MAKTGLENFRYGILTEAQDGTPTYAAPKKPGAAIDCTVDVSNNNGNLYADNTVQESDTSFAGGTVTIGIDRYDYKTMGELLGHTVTEDNQISRNKNDSAPYVGLGRVINEIVDNHKKYSVEFLYKVKFGEPSQENTTQGENVEFTGYTLEGTLAELKNGKWSEAKQFDDRATAIAWLEGCLGRQYEIQYNVNGGQGEIQNQDAVAGRPANLHDGEGLRGPENAPRFLGWALTAAGAVLRQYIPMADQILYAIWGPAEG